MIDLPQVVDVIAHPNGRGFLERDATNVARWFAARGLRAADPEKLAGLLVEEARLDLRKFPGPQGGADGPGKPVRPSASP
jgi:serine/threonine-protein kinase RIO1